MDLSSIIGLVLGISAIVVGNTLEGTSISSILQPTAALIVFGGTIGSVILGYPSKSIRGALHTLRDVFRQEHKGVEEVISEMVTLAYKARREGIIALEENAQKTDDLFLKKALNLLSDGADSRLLRETMEIEMSHMEEEKESAVKVFEYAGGLAPTIGIIGAVLGLIHVMQNLTDPSKLGSGIAVAFVATVYGVGVANLIFFPFGKKIQNKAKAMMVYYEAILEGILSVQNGDNPRMIEEKLKGYLNAKEKAGYVSVDKRAKAPGAAKAA